MHGIDAAYCCTCRMFRGVCVCPCVRPPVRPAKTDEPIGERIVAAKEPCILAPRGERDWLYRVFDMHLDRGQNSSARENFYCAVINIMTGMRDVACRLWAPLRSKQAVCRRHCHRIAQYCSRDTETRPMMPVNHPHEVTFVSIYDHCRFITWMCVAELLGQQQRYAICNKLTTVQKVGQLT